MGWHGHRMLVSLAAALSLTLAPPGPLAAATTDRGQHLARDYIVVLRPGGANTVAVRRAALERARGFSSRRDLALVNGFAARLTPAQLLGLRADRRVAFIDEDRPFHGAASEPLASGEVVSNGVKRIEAVAGGRVRGPSGINVAVLDTGIDLLTPDLNAVDGKNCIGPGPAFDDVGHGTASAGTIAARNNGKGGVGVAPGTRVVSVKVLDNKLAGTTSTLICGIEWVTSTLTDDDPTNDIRVASMSIYGRAAPVTDCAVTQDALHRAICASTAAGVTYVVSAGNTAGPFDHPARPAIVPAAYPEVLTATGMADSDGKPGGTGGPPKCRESEADEHAAIFSSFAVTELGASHTIASPAVCIRAILPGGRYKVGSGTSQTAPHIAGAVALCMNDGGVPGPCAGLAPAEVIQRMRADAAAWAQSNPGYGFVGDPSQPIAGRYYGYLVRVGTGPPPEPDPTASGSSRVPVGVTVKQGVRLSGGFGRLAANDGTYLEVRSTATPAPAAAWIARIGDVPRDALSLSLTVSGHGTRACTQVISVRRFTTLSWVELDRRVVDAADAVVELEIPGAPAAFIKGGGATGEVRVRVSCSGSGARFRLRTDLLELGFGP
ncbi:MAG TPA: S8 family serine peptidase [Candidatus Limnocylindrales bacterium]